MAANQVIEHPTSTGLDNRKVAMWTFLASDCMFFGALITVYMVAYPRATVGPFPEDIFDIPFTSVSAFVLLMSSLAMVLALGSLQKGNIPRFRIWMAAVALLGCIFLGGQIYEFTEFYHAGLSPQSSIFGSAFFVLTGFHGTHVFIGVIWLLSLLFASFKKGIVTPAKSLNVEMAGLYWHFVDIVWIVIFTVVYLFQA